MQNRHVGHPLKSALRKNQKTICFAVPALVAAGPAYRRK